VKGAIVMKKINDPERKKFVTIRVREDIWKKVKNFCIDNDLTMQEYINMVLEKQFRKRDPLT